MKKRLASILAALTIGLSPSLSSLAQTDDLGNNTKEEITGVVRINYSSQLEKEAKKNAERKEKEEYEERREHFEGKGVDIDKFVTYLDQNYTNRLSNTLVLTHETLKEVGKKIEDNVDEFLGKYGWKFKISGGKENQIISASLVYDF